MTKLIPPNPPPPFLRMEITGQSAVGNDKIVITRDTYDNPRVKIETSARLIFCNTRDLRAVLETLTHPEKQKTEGN